MYPWTEVGRGGPGNPLDQDNKLAGPSYKGNRLAGEYLLPVHLCTLCHQKIRPGKGRIAIECRHDRQPQGNHGLGKARQA